MSSYALIRRAGLCALIYENDIAQYGALDPSIRVAPAATVDGWVGTLDEETSLVAN